jgi:hypothetical protein
MKPMFQCLTIVVASIAAAFGASAQEPALPIGNWQSASETITWALHPALSGGELFLKIDVSNDGSFRGEWGELFCFAGSLYFSCRPEGKSERVSGRFGTNREGVIDLGRLGRSAFKWSVPSVNELTIELPKNWRGADATLYRARMTRDGKGKAATATPPPGNAGPVSSAVALYREFDKDEKAALNRYAGKTVRLEGRRGDLIPLSDGGAAIHIADGFRSRALVLVFRNMREVSGIGEGAQFRFTCTVESFDSLYVQMKDCSIVR